MIAPMVRFSFAVYHANYEEFLDDIQEIGTVHIKGQKNENYVEKLTDLQKDFGDSIQTRKRRAFYINSGIGTMGKLFILFC